jgi:hypothetical protein
MSAVLWIGLGVESGAYATGLEVAFFLKIA